MSGRRARAARRQARTDWPPAVGVCGFPRCGSSMMMRILDAGGVEPVAGTQPGSYEVSDLRFVSGLGPGVLSGRAVKLLDFGSGHYGRLPTSVAWKFVWLDRDPVEQARSQKKLLAFLGDVEIAALIDPVAFAETGRARGDRDVLVEWCRSRGEVWEGSFEAILADPMTEVRDLARFLDRPFKETAAAAVVEARSPACAEGLDFEVGLVRDAGFPVRRAPGPV